jgi:hypothetical protein
MKGVATRNPQISIQLAPHLKRAYELLDVIGGLNPRRLAAAGLFWLVENAAERQRALDRLATLEDSIGDFPDDDACIAYVRRWATPANRSAASAAVEGRRVVAEAAEQSELPVRRPTRKRTG